MKLWVPFVYELNSDILSYSSLVGCVFSPPDCDSAFCDSKNKLCVAIFNTDLSFGLDSTLKQSEKKSRLSTAIACAFSQFTFLCKTFL